MTDTRSLCNTQNVTHRQNKDTANVNSRWLNINTPPLSLLIPSPPHKSNDSKDIPHLGALVFTTPQFFIC